MKVGCTICADTLRDSFAAAPCGHTFHHTCLLQWLGHRKTCPQCRERCPPRQVLKLFLEGDQRTSSSQSDSLSVEELRERVVDQDQLIKQKDEALVEARDELQKVREEVEAWQVTNEATQLKLQRQKSLNESLQMQMRMFKADQERGQRAEVEAIELKRKLETLQSIQQLLEGSSQDAQQIIGSSSTADLVNYVVAMKTEYESIKERKSVLHKDKLKLSHEVTSLRRQLQRSDQELQQCRSKLVVCEGDINSLEQERERLQKKLELLEKALESPGSRQVWRRVLESPMPEIASKHMKLDNTASPALREGEGVREGGGGGGVTVSVSDGTGDRPCLTDKSNHKHISTERSQLSEPTALVPVQRLSAVNRSTIGMSAGFNGFGGQSSFVVPQKPPGPHPREKPFTFKKLKFAPRQGASDRGRPLKQTQLATKLKF